MVSAARQKIDPQTRQLFDAEVDKPKHDEILTSLFRSDERLLALITRVHAFKDLKPFSSEDRFRLVDRTYGSPFADRQTVTFEEAVQLTGSTPRWSSLSRIRGLRKTLESPLSMETGTRSTRIMGFIDMLLSYQLISGLFVERGDDRKYTWIVDSMPWSMLVEVKGEWPTAGNLLRQLNLYRECRVGGEVKRVVIGPDDSVNDLVCEHGWRLATFNEDIKISLVPAPKAAKKQKLSPNEF